MEKFFIVTEESALGKDYLKFEESTKIVNEFAKDFFKKNDIETTEYAPYVDSLYIVPTEKDEERFDKYLKKDSWGNARAFKKNSKINKEWVQGIKEKGIKIQHKPLVNMYFRGYGKSWSRIFKQNGIIYCSFETEYGEVERLEGLVEIKASEFYKIIEEFKGETK